MRPEKEGKFDNGRVREFARTASISCDRSELGVCPLSVRSLPKVSEMPPRSLAPQLHSFAFVTILGSCLTGCTWFEDLFDDSVTLTDLAPVAANVSAEMNDSSRSQLVLQPKDGVCPTIRDDVEANVDGKSMDVYIKGAKQPSGSSWICAMPTFRRNVTDADIGAASTTFVAKDDTKTITVEATGLLLDRNLTESDSTVPFLAGVEKSFVWSVPTDEIDATVSNADFVYDDRSLMLKAEVTFRVEGSLVFIRLPTDAPDGPGTLTVDVTTSIPIAKCEGVAACSGSARVVQDLVMTAGPPAPGP